MDKHYDITIVRVTEGEEIIQRTTHLTPEQIEDIGGIGKYIESIATMLIDEERIEIEFRYE